MICSVIQEILEHSTPSVNILTRKAFEQQSTRCVRSAQHAKEQKQLIRNMENCHLNRLKQIPGTLYVQTSLVHIWSLEREKTRLNCGALRWSILPQCGLIWHKYPIKGCWNCRYHQENLVYLLPTSTENCVWSWYRIYGWICQDVSKWLWPKKETNNN